MSAIPMAALACALAAMFATIADSGILSIRPSPIVGVGMRKMMLGFPPRPLRPLPAGRKFGWVMVQLPASLRPVITNRSCTPPSGTPFDSMKRASRTGPFGTTNHGMVLVAPSAVATAVYLELARVRDGLAPRDVIEVFA